MSTGNTETKRNTELSLENDHNVYILGAGFSAEGALPLVSNFLHRMRDSHPWLLAMGREWEAEAVRRVLQFRLRATSSSYWTKVDLENIEELFSLAAIREREDSLLYYIRVAIAATLDFAWQTSARKSRTLVFESGHQDMFQQPPSWFQRVGSPGVPTNTYQVPAYAYFAARLLGFFQTRQIIGRNTFVTFNYDTLLEDGLTAMETSFSYGFKPNKVKVDAGVKAYDENSSVKVLKLHGSVNWRVGLELGLDEMNKLVVSSSYEKTRIQPGPGRISSEIVPPTWNKKIDDALIDVWDSAVDELRTATRIYIIGFSMPPTDMHFKYLLAAGLKENISLREIVFVNPDAERLKERVLNAFRAEHIDAQRIRFESSALGPYLTRPWTGLPSRPVKEGLQFYAQ